MAARSNQTETDLHVCRRIAAGRSAGHCELFDRFGEDIGLKEENEINLMIYCHLFF